MEFGEKLRLLRKQHNITQEQLAMILGVERSSVGKYEGKSKVIPSDDIKRRIADYFGVSMDYLLDHHSENEASTIPTLSADEQRLLAAYRSADDRAREDALNTLLSHPRGTKKKSPA